MHLRLWSHFLAIIFLAVVAGARAQSPLINFTNPVAPAIDEQFGFSVAAVGDKVLIGVPKGEPPGVAGSDHGKAYLFNTNGTVFMLITNPIPKPFEFFGNAVAAFGADRVLVAAYEDYDYVGNIHAGTVYLLSTNSTRLMTFTNPTPSGSEQFGSAVAQVGGDKVLIGAHLHADRGEAYLFNTNGTLLTTITNPAFLSSGAVGGHFGFAVAALGADKMIIGAYDHSAAYIYDVNGTRLVTLTNPAPTQFENFGYAVAAVGTDKVLIGAPSHNNGIAVAGEAYLFDLNGTRLTTFTNPDSVFDDRFGNAVCAVGTDKVVIAAYRDDAGADSAGTCYLFNLSGTLLNTYTNPTPQNGDYNGWAVASMSGDRFVVGAILDNARGTDAGTAYLYGVPATALPNPTLRIFRTNSNIAIAWPAPSAGWALQSHTNLVTTNWSPVTNAVSVAGSENQVVISPPAGNRFFRLFKP